MEKIKVVQSLIQEYADFFNNANDNPHIKYECITDTMHQHFQIVKIGWRGQHRVYGIIFHIDVIEDKIWIQQNNSEFDIFEEFIESGITKHEIVLGYIMPEPELA